MKNVNILSALKKVTKSLIFSSILSASILSMQSSLVWATDSIQGKGALAKINIRLSGTIVALGCTVDPGDVDKTVILGDWSGQQIHDSGKSIPVEFSIHLTGCTGNGVSLTFTGLKDSNDSTLLALNSQSTAKGVAIEILDDQHKRLPIGNNSPRIIFDNEGDAILKFFARYVAVAPVSTGTAYADSDFTLSYD